MDEHSSNPIIKSAYQVLFHQMTDGVIVLDNDHKILSINQSAEKILSSSTDALIGQAFADVIKSSFDVDVPLSDLSKTRLSCTSKGTTYYYDVDVKTLSGDGGYLVSLKDVTEITSLRSDYSEFAHTISHDVKAPLGIAVGYSNMLQSELEDGTEQRFFVDEIFNTTMRIMNICNELVLLSDLEHLESIESMPVDMRFSIENAMRRFQHVSDTRSVTLNIDDNLSYVKGNAPWVEEAIVDYLHYAMVKNPSATNITIDVSATDDKQIRFAIQHNGTDAPVTNVEDMFSDDISLSSIRAEGYGLGLNVAKRLIELMGGEVHVEGKALTFTLPTMPSKSK